MFDKDGNMINWWSEKSKEEYDKLASCFQEQYRNLTNAVLLGVSRYNFDAC